MVAARVAVQSLIAAGAGRVELGAGGVGLRGATAGLDPENLEVGQRGAELLVGEGVALLDLAQDGNDLVAQPARLGVRAQEQADVGGRGVIGIVGHAEHPCSREIGTGLRISSGLSAGGRRGLEDVTSLFVF